MKKRLRRLGRGLALVMVMLFIFGVPVASLASNATVKSISIYPGYMELPVGQRVILMPEVTPGGEKLLWESSNAQVATVDGNGKVAALAEGETQITMSLATDPAIKAVCLLHVIPEGSILLFKQNPPPEAPQGPPQEGLPEPGEPTGQEQVEQEIDIPIEIDPQLDKDLELDPEKMKELTKTAVWTLTFKGPSLWPVSYPAMKELPYTFEINWSARKEGGATLGGTYTALPGGSLRMIADMAMFNKASQGIATFNLSWAGPLQKSSFALDNQLEKITVPVLKGGNAVLVNQMTRSSKSTVYWDAAVETATNKGSHSGYSWNQSFMSGPTPGEITYHVYTYDDLKVSLVLNLGGVLYPWFEGKITKKVVWK